MHIFQQNCRAKLKLKRQRRKQKKEQISVYATLILSSISILSRICAQASKPTCIPFDSIKKESDNQKLHEGRKIQLPSLKLTDTRKQMVTGSSSFGHRFTTRRSCFSLTISSGRFSSVINSSTSFLALVLFICVTFIICTMSHKM